MSDIYSFGPFRVDPNKMQLSRDGEPLPARPQVVKLLRILLENSGSVLRYEELWDLVWDRQSSRRPPQAGGPAERDESVDRHTMSVTVTELRKVLGEFARCVRNRPTIGYFFEHPEHLRGSKKRDSAHRTCLTLMPFDDLTRDRDKNYLAAGIASELATTLGKIDTLRIIKATPHTLRFFKSPPTDIQYLLEGQLTGEGDRLKVHVQVRSSVDQTTICADTYEPNASETMLQIQPRIAKRIAGMVRVNISIQETKRMESAKRVDDETYKLYLKGLYHWSRPTEIDLFRALEYFRESTMRDSSYARAFAGIAHTYGLLAFGGFLRPDGAMSQAKGAALRCLELSPNSEEGLTALAAVEAYNNWNWSEAEELLKRAISVNSNYETAHHLYAMGCLMPQQRLDEAFREIRLTESLNPLSPFVVSCVGIVQYYARDFQGALEQFDRALELQPHYHLAHWHRGWALAAMRRFDAAIHAAQKAVEISQSAPQVLAALAQVYASAGRLRECRKILGQLKVVAADRYVSPYDLALIYATLGESSRAFTFLRRAVDERVPTLARLPVHPVFDCLRGESRFDELLATVNLTNAGHPVKVESRGKRPRPRPSKKRR